jgi:hypothetical protein
VAETAVNLMGMTVHHWFIASTKRRAISFEYD